MNSLEDCDGRPKPCCTTHYPKCWAGCGDDAQRVKSRGKVVGAFCHECFAEVMNGTIPKNTPKKGRMSMRARLRALRGD